MQQSDRAGLLFALAGFCLLTVGDAIIKGVDGAWPPTAVASLRYTIGALGLTALLLLQEGAKPLERIPDLRFQWLRGASVGFATVCFFAGVWLMPLTEAIAIIFTQPMITALLASVFLKERLRASTIAASVIAFIGVLIILRPNFAAIGWAALLPLGAAVGMSVLMTANRAVRGQGSALAMQAYVAIFGAITLLAFTLIGHLSGAESLQLSPPSADVVVRCLIVACTASAAHWLIYKATESAGAGTIAPMTYGQMIMASVLGYIFFSEVPDRETIFGAAIIIGSGLWLWWQGRVRMIDSAEH
ncbi:DMT family transporter [Aurantiacibacter gangjinensis]|uniref:Uncharacterized protein n=1 Tax=Aurantiacibacter gangjinensis TaxID=502682 RepID=A0A0G9MR93_9SPHN|nr:DMT family transporter [Aurantiacibacter gangjinensis]APE29143.1 Membrane protein, putative [Aurantiacibacter gangjinensis]KLE33220.1 hypothetical protein AAW01_04455 [Aurantiacibacter gangjinensis]